MAVTVLATIAQKKICAARRAPASGGQAASQDAGVGRGASAGGARACHVSVCDHEDATSSSAKSSPPVGAPKAEATPAAAPAVKQSLASLLFRKWRRSGSAQPRVAERI